MKEKEKLRKDLESLEKQGLVERIEKDGKTLWKLTEAGIQLGAAMDKEDK